MPRQQTQLVNGEIYHIILRAVGDTEIFFDESDHYRGIFSIYEFNNANVVEIWRRRRDRAVEKKIEKSVGSPRPHGLLADERNRIVDVLTFSLMPNHIHLIVKQLKDGGISQFMQKLGGGYANYFNKKYNRKGHLFNQFRAIHIKSDEQLRNVFVYVHANIASLIEPGWKEKGIKNPKKVIKFLENYKWHSHGDYIGRQNFPSVTQREIFLEALGGKNGCKEAIEDWISYRKEPKDFGDIVLE